MINVQGAKPSKMYIAFGGFVLLIFLMMYDISARHSTYNLSEQIIREKLIQERLKESEAIWKKGVETREAAEKESPISPDAPWTPVDYRSIWDFLYPTFNCPHSVERLGRLGDGGKWICGISHIASKPNIPCTVFSYGISGDTSFEEDVVSRASHCYVYGYDHTINNGETLPLFKRFPKQSSYFKLGLGAENKEEQRTLKTEMDRHGVTWIDILKIDTEGMEYWAFPQILKDFPDALPFGQLLVELHLDYYPKPDLYKNVKRWWTSLEDVGFRAYWTEPNIIASLMGSKYPSYYEISFINTRVDHMLLHA